MKHIIATERLAFAQDYARLHGWERPHWGFACTANDSQFCMVLEGKDPREIDLHVVNADLTEQQAYFLRTRAEKYGIDPTSMLSRCES